MKSMVIMMRMKMTEGIVWFIINHLRNNQKILVPPRHQTILRTKRAIPVKIP